MAPIKKSEEEVGRIWDRCFVDTSIKAVSGAIVGSVFSLLFFKRKTWPVTLGLGVGIGAGYTNCRHQFWWRRHHHPHAHGPGTCKHGPPRPPFWTPPWSRKDGAIFGKDKKEEKPMQTEEIPPQSPEKPTESCKDCKLD